MGSDIACSMFSMGIVIVSRVYSHSILPLSKIACIMQPHQCYTRESTSTSIIELLSLLDKFFLSGGESTRAITLVHDHS